MAKMIVRTLCTLICMLQFTTAMARFLALRPSHSKKNSSSSVDKKWKKTAAPKKLDAEGQPEEEFFDKDFPVDGNVTDLHQKVFSESTSGAKAAAQGKELIKAGKQVAATAESLSDARQEVNKTAREAKKAGKAYDKAHAKASEVREEREEEEEKIQRAADLRDFFGNITEDAEKALKRAKKANAAAQLNYEKILNASRASKDRARSHTKAERKAKAVLLSAKNATHAAIAQLDNATKEHELALDELKAARGEELPESGAAALPRFAALCGCAVALSTALLT